MNKISKQSAFTLVELLVAISILTIVTALVIPRLRTINKERNIREAARVVGSVFSSARDLAVAEGIAGVVIVRNPNFVSRTIPDDNRVFFAGTRLFQLRPKAPFTGDANSDFAFVILTTDSSGNDVLQCMINLPLDHDPVNGLEVISPGDKIKLGTAGATFRIKEVLPYVPVTFQTSGGTENLCGLDVTGSVSLDMLPLNLAFDDDNIPDNLLFETGTTDFSSGEPAPRYIPAAGSYMVSDVRKVAYCDFSAERLRKIQSSVVDLPAGYIIDLRYSGPFDPRDIGGFDGDIDTYTVMGLGLANGADETLAVNSEIQVLFDRRGSLERLDVNNTSLLAGQSLQLFVNEYDPSQISTDTIAQAETLLSEPDSFWVTVGLNGGTNIGYNAPPEPGGVNAMIDQARSISRGRTSARQ